MDPPELASEPAPCYACRGRIEPPGWNPINLQCGMEMGILNKFGREDCSSSVWCRGSHEDIILDPPPKRIKKKCLVISTTFILVCFGPKP
jgi:hypothetical protein